MGLVSMGKLLRFLKLFVLIIISLLIIIVILQAQNRFYIKGFTTIRFFKVKELPKETTQTYLSCGGAKIDGETTEPQKPAIPEVVEANKPQVEIKTTYKINDRGDKMLEIQKKLNKFGYNLLEDGIFGDKTYAAVIDFQKRAGLVVDGVIGPETLAKLDMEPTEEMMYKADPKDKPTPSESSAEEYINSQDIVSSTEYLIWVDTSKFKVNFFTGSKNEWVLLRSMLCSLGAPATPTPKGFFVVGEKGPMFRVNSSVICKYYTQFYGNYLFHSVLLNNDGEVVDGRLGVRISHGCIRLSIENAKYLNETVPTGTKVWIK